MAGRNRAGARSGASLAPCSPYDFSGREWRYPAVEPRTQGDPRTAPAAGIACCACQGATAPDIAASLTMAERSTRPTRTTTPTSATCSGRPTSRRRGPRPPAGTHAERQAEEARLGIAPGLKGNTESKFDPQDHSSLPTVDSVLVPRLCSSPLQAFCFQPPCRSQS